MDIRTTCFGTKNNMSNKTQYKTICQQHPQIPVCTQHHWLNATCAKWDVAIAMKGDHVRGVWAYPLEQKAGVSLIRNPFFTPYLGPTVFFPHDMKESNRDSYEHETIAELLKQMPKADVWHMALQPGIKQAGLFRQYGLEQTVQQTFLIDLQQDEPTLLANMKDSLRKNIRQAEKELTITADPAALPQLYSFYTTMLARKKKTPFMSQADLQKLLDACTANNSGTLWVARSNDTIHGILWHVWDARCGYALSLGQNPDSDNYKAMSLLMWHAMKASKQMGQHTFDCEGSMDPGVERFYRTFGGRRELYLILSKNDSTVWKLKQLIRG